MTSHAATRTSTRSKPSARRGAARLGQLFVLLFALLLIAVAAYWFVTGGDGGANSLLRADDTLQVRERAADLNDRARESNSESLLAALPNAEATRSDLREGVRLPGDGRLEGQVFGREDGAAVRHARVELLALPPVGSSIIGRVLRIGRLPAAILDRARPVAVTTTDDLGLFQFEGVRRGKYYIDVISEFYLPEAPKQVQVLASGAGGPVEVWMLVGGSVTGTVLDPDGRALTNARVMLEPGPNLFLEIIRRGTFRILETSTDDNGRFLFGGVAPGSGYDVTATAPQIAVSHAVSVDVVARAQTEVTVRARRGGQVRGKVVSVVETGAGDQGAPRPLAGAHVGAIPRGLRDLRFMEEILRQTHCVTEADGSYEMSRVPPGEIDVVAYAPNHLLGSGALVSVIDSQTSNALPVELQRGAQLHGRFVDSAGAPIEGVHVRWMTFDVRELARRGMELSFAPLMALAVEGFDFPASDANGRFVAGPFPGNAPHMIHYYKVGFSDSSYAWTPGAGTASDGSEVEIVMHRGGSLEGIVMDLDAAEPITSFTIETIDRIETSADSPGRFNPFSGGEPFENAEGHFRLEAMRAGKVSLTFESDGYSPEIVHDIDIVEGGATRGVIVTMSRGAVIRGRVVDEKGAPIGGANVMALDPAKRMGRGFGDLTRDLERPPTRRLDFVEAFPPGLLGYAAGVGLLGDSAVRSKADGSFELRGVEPGTTIVVAFHPKYAPSSVDGLLAVRHESIEDVELVLSTGAAVFGAVTDRHGSPVAESMVLALSPLGMGAGRAQDVGDGLYQSKTNESGEYEIEHMKGGSYFIVSTRGDAAMNPMSLFSTLDFDLLTVPDNERVRFDIVDESLGATRVYGRVLDAGDPVGGGSISALSWEGENFLGVDWKLGRVDGAGNYEFEGLAPGEYQFELAGSVQRSRITVEVPDQPEFQRDLLLPTGTIAGVVIERETREPVRRAVAYLRPPTEEGGEGLIASFLRSQGRRLRSTTNADGAFRFSRLAPGKYELIIQPPGTRSGSKLAPSDAQHFVLEEGRAFDDLIIELRSALAVKGRVRTADGTPVADALVVCQQEGKQEIRPSRSHTDADGFFTIEGLAPGMHTFSASANGFASARRDGVEIGAAEQADVDLVLVRGVEVSVRVYGSDGRVLSGASAELRRTDAPDAGAADPENAVRNLFSGDNTTDAQGWLSLGRFVPGTYELTVWRGFSRQTRPSVQLEHGQNELELRVHL